jgi:UDP-N-acetylmuramyl pentapeptide phosphotransferase/UDP-N-acetylglucosamine-1-phosphate transferase
MPADSYARVIAIVVGVAVTSWLLVAVLREYALAQGLLDVPKERSSHAVPTPRGGGIGPVAATIIGYIVAVPESALDWRIMVALAGVLPTAYAGWLDDKISLPVWPRVAAHLASGVLILPLALGSSPPTMVTILLGAAWLVATVSAINVVNFIDGIDGLIGLQSLVFAAHLAMLGGIDSPGGILGLALAAASAGFLIWNWAPARIFLGDAGSGSVAVLCLTGGILVWKAGNWPFVAVFLPLLPIFLDATVTILRRARRGEDLTSAHRSHLYQRLANDGRWGHARVSLLYGGVAAVGSLIVLFTQPEWLPVGIAFYAAGVVAIAWRLDRSLSRA